MKKLRPWWWDDINTFVQLITLKVPSSLRNSFDFFAWEQQWADSIGLGINHASKRGRGKSKPEKDNCPKCHCPWSAHDKIYGCTTGDAGGGSCGCRERKSKRRKVNGR